MVRLFLYLIPLFSIFPFSASAESIDAKINQLIQPLTDILSAFIFYSVPLADTQVPVIVVWLIFAAFFFTFYLGFINLRGFGYAVKVVRGALYDDKHDGEISHFQALTAAMSGTIGVGNMAGVAITVSLGGAGGNLLADCRRAGRHDDKIRRMHIGCQISHYQSRRHRLGRADVLFARWSGRKGPAASR